MMFGMTVVDGAIMGFNELGDFSPVTDLYMSLSPVADNLMIRVGGVDMSLNDAGYGDGYWHLGLRDAEGYIVGWAKNSSGNPLRKGWLVGEYSGSATYGLADGEKPVSLILIYDALNDGIGNVGGTTLYVGDDDLVFTEADILFNDVLGGVSMLPIYHGNGDPSILPHMVVVIPEPATLFVFGIGGLSLIRKRFK